MPKITTLRLSDNERKFLTAISDNGRIIQGVRVAITKMGFTEDDVELVGVIKEIMKEKMENMQ